MEPYDHKAVEKKWQEKWEKTQAFKASENNNKEKFYGLVEFPYPSGEGLHTGHVRSYTAMDVIARKRRAQGKEVLFPIGWDAFGLPTENYAIKTGKDPKIVTKENTDTFRRQLKSLGLSFDWSREVNTTDPSYYKWTQWIFLQLYKHGLAYKAKTTINWCPVDKIGLANEEVVDGHCDRCGSVVEKREKDQWLLSITKYAQRLYDDLDEVDYIERAKTQQRNWIGPSQGAEIEFPLAAIDRKIKVFTTRPDTLFGATYMVLAPEHPLIGQMKERIQNWSEVSSYIDTARKKSELDRTAEGKEKTGVELKGVKAINPASKEEIPIFVADYVLGSYGTGAIMAVPAHDERDYAFAKKFNLPIKRVVEPLFTGKVGDGAVREGEPFVKRNAVCVILRNPKDDTYLCNSWKSISMHGLLTEGIEDGESPFDAAQRGIREETGYQHIRLVQDTGIVINTQFYQRQKQQNRWARFHYVVVELEDEERAQVDPEEEAKHEFLWLKKEELKDFFNVFEGEFILEFLDNPDYIHTGPGVVYNSGQFDWMYSEEAKQKNTEYVGGTMVTTYKLRDWIFSRQRYWGEPIPMVHCKKDGWVPVPEADLPVALPQVAAYQPTDTGESPLAAITEWVNTICPTCGGPATRETDVMPNWAGSSWYYLRYCDPQDDKQFAAMETLKYWTPVDWYNGGMEHTVLHLLYSRFWHKFLYDIGVVPTTEPYAKRTSHGLILAGDGTKMSKSKGNVVNPDELVERMGADALRLYEMFMGPFEQAIAWNTDGVVGMRRFVERVWRLGVLSRSGEMKEMNKILHHTIKKVGEDIESLKFNTAVSQMMILLNAAEDAGGFSQEEWRLFLPLLAPFAPHLANELSERLSVPIDAWPVYDPALLQALSVTVAVQVNGKVRASLELAPDASQDEALAAARSEPAVAKWFAGGREVKALYVPGRIISFVVEAK